MIPQKQKLVGNPEVLVLCRRCAGEGRIPLTGVYADTLSLLRKQKKELSGAALARLVSINGTAMNNRLTWLERHGLAVGRWNGHERLWKEM